MGTRERRRRRDDEHEREPLPVAAVDERARAVLAAQRAYGNHAVSRILARDANPALEGKRAVRPPKPKLRTGREVDAIFDASPLLKQLAGAKLGRGTIQKAMKIDAEAEFERAWVAYAQRSHNPQTDKNYTEDEARQFLASKGVRAFQDEDRGEIHIRRDRADLGTQLHEGIHVFAHDRWRRRMGYAVNEGVTELFTRKVGPEVQVERDDSSFLREFTSATHLVTAAGEPAVAAAYFDGDLAGLERAVDARGKGTWKRWLEHLDANDFKAANKLLTS
jgi:hypothetical protein